MSKGWTGVWKFVGMAGSWEAGIWEPFCTAPFNILILVPKSLYRIGGGEYTQANTHQQQDGRPAPGGLQTGREYSFVAFREYSLEWKRD